MQDQPREVRFISNGFVKGAMANSRTARYEIDKAHAGPWDKEVQWNTPDLPGVDPGEEGGPLYLDFQGGKTGADVYIRGYLYKCALPYPRACDRG